MSEEITITKEETIETTPTINSTETAASFESVSQTQAEAAPQAAQESAPQTAPETATKAAPETATKTEPDPGPSPQPHPASAASDVFENEFPDEPDEESKPRRRFFRPRSSELEFSRDKWILSRIDDAHMMEYLTLEQKRFEQTQAAKEKRERRIFTAFRLTVSLAAIVAVVYLLKDNPTILVNILYIAGILAAIWFLKNPKDKAN